MKLNFVVQAGYLAVFEPTGSPTSQFGFTQCWEGTGSFPVDEEVQQLWDQLESQLWQSLFSVLPSTLAIVNATVSLWQAGSPTVHPVTSTLTGARSGQTLPSTSAVNVQMATGFRGRQYRGRHQIGPVMEEDTRGDFLTDTGLARWRTAVAPLNSVLSYVEYGQVELTLQPVVFSRQYSYFEGASWIAVGEYTTAVIVNPMLSSWRRRRPD